MAAGKGEQATGSLAARQSGENWFLIRGEGRGGLGGSPTPLGGAVCRRQAWYPVFAPGFSKVALVFFVSLYLLSRTCACTQLRLLPSVSLYLLLEETCAPVLLLLFLELLSGSVS